MNARSKKPRKTSTLFLPGVSDYGLVTGSLSLGFLAATLDFN